MIIAVDGPAASGKGTVARRLARAYGLAYLDTGKIYRALAVAALEAECDLEDGEAVAKLAPDLSLDSLDDPGLRAPHVGGAASTVAAHPPVRAALLAAQRAFAARPTGAILDGRDIGTVVCPDADVKLFVTASLAARVERRGAELRSLGHAIDDEALAADLAARDARDRERAAAPLKPAPDARLLDTTLMGIDEAFEAARRLVEEARLTTAPGG